MNCLRFCYLFILMTFLLSGCVVLSEEDIPRIGYNAQFQYDISLESGKVWSKVQALVHETPHVNILVDDNDNMLISWTEELNYSYCVANTDYLSNLSAMAVNVVYVTKSNDDSTVYIRSSCYQLPEKENLKPYIAHEVSSTGFLELRVLKMLLAEIKKPVNEQ